MGNEQITSSTEKHYNHCGWKESSNLGGGIVIDRHHVWAYMVRQVSHLVPEVWYRRAIKQIQYIPLPPPIKQHYEVTQLLWAISREIILYVSIKGQLKNIFLMWCRTKWTCYKIFKKQLHYRRAQDLHLVQGCPPALARVIVSSPSLAALCPMDEHEPQMLQQLQLLLVMVDLTWRKKDKKLQFLCYLYIPSFNCKN